MQQSAGLSLICCPQLASRRLQPASVVWVRRSYAPWKGRSVPTWRLASSGYGTFRLSWMALWCLLASTTRWRLLWGKTTIWWSYWPVQPGGVYYGVRQQSDGLIGQCNQVASTMVTQQPGIYYGVRQQSDDAVVFISQYNQVASTMR